MYMKYTINSIHNHSLTIGL